jgi:fructose-1,6-bisphosphatase/inositol monophosphatase family enzyme
VRNRPKAGEASEAKAALTIADSAAQEAILVPLAEHFPQVALEAEEDTPSVERFAARGEALVVVDPIDGTLRSYLGGQGPYAVLVGLALGGRYHAALVALPREDLFFDATRGGGARSMRGHERPHRARFDPDARRVMVSYDAPVEVERRLEARGFEVVRGCGGALAVAPLLPGVAGGLRIASQGSDISVRGRIGLLVAREAGARLARECGEPFPDGLADPARALLVARDDAVLAVLGEALGAAGL